MEEYAESKNHNSTTLFSELFSLGIFGMKILSVLKL